MDQLKIKAGIVGGAGYTGGELIRLLLRHPNTTLSFVQSSSNAGKPLHAVHADLIGETNLLFVADHSTNIDVLFLCSGHGHARKFLEQHKLPADLRIVDLGNDFRLQADSQIGIREFVYGLPELNLDKIRSAQNIANPGCFATAITLGLLPFAAQGLLSSVHTTGITGSTGAGQSLSATSHFSWRQNNIQAYKTLTHQHMGEVTESINHLQKRQKLNQQPIGNAIRFVPWRGDFTRGIFVSSCIQTDLALDSAYELFESFYSKALFTHISRSAIFLKQVINTNKCVIQLEKEGDTLVIHSAIDNLLKGASGQAVQNMNIMFGLDERAGLNLKSSYF